MGRFLDVYIHLSTVSDIFRMTRQGHSLTFKEFLKRYCQVLAVKRFLIFGGMLSMCKCKAELSITR